MLLAAWYTTYEVVEEVERQLKVKETLSHQVPMDIWTNVGWSWHYTSGLELYINGQPKTEQAKAERQVFPAVYIYYSHSKVTYI